jgi:hypothetical protein
VQSTECGVRSAEYRVLSKEYGVLRTEYCELRTVNRALPPRRRREAGSVALIGGVSHIVDGEKQGAWR